MANTNYSCAYISDRAYKDLLDFNNVNSETFYVVHYEDVLPGVTEPIIDVFLGKHRLSAIINLDAVPAIDISRYINVNVLKDNLKDITRTVVPSATVDIEKIEENIDELIDNLADSDIINTQTMLPTNIGQSNKLYLYFDKVARKYQMYIFHPTLSKFIPLKLDPITIKTSGGGGGPSGGETIVEKHLHIDNAAIITTDQVSALNVQGEDIGFDLDAMASIRYSYPESNIVVQGLICNDFSLTQVEELYKNFSLQVYYNNTMYNFNIVSYLAEYGYLMNSTYKLSDNMIYTKFTYEFFRTDNNAAPVITLNGYMDKRHATTVGMCINVKTINGPEVDAQLFPYGYVDADLTIVGRSYSNAIDNYIYLPNFNSEANFTTYLTQGINNVFDTLNATHYVAKQAYDNTVSKITVKIPFASLTEYRFNVGLTELSEITEVNS